MASDSLKVWVLAGQSNMEGCGFLKGCAEPDERVHCFTSAGSWELAIEPLHRLWESYTPVHQDLMRAGGPEWTDGKSDEQLAKDSAATRTHGAGLGLSFGRALADATGERIGLIPCAHGGTSMDQWSPELAPSEGNHSLYGAMIDRIKRAGGELQGVLWYQGESDGGPGLASTYQARMTRWIEAVRRDTGVPDLPVIVVQLGCFACNPRMTLEQGRPWDMVRDALADLAVALPNVAAVSAIDLELTDLIHISTPCLQRLGRRMARAAHLMLSGGAYCSAPQIASMEAAKAENIPGWATGGAIRLKFSGVTGGWSPKYHMAGFGLYNSDGDLHEKYVLWEASVDPEDPSAILLLLNGTPDDTIWIGYGRGLYPYCNVVDDADMALLTFMRQFGA